MEEGGTNLARPWKEQGRKDGTWRAMEMEMRGFADAADGGGVPACASVMPMCVPEPSYAHIKGRTFTPVIA